MSGRVQSRRGLALGLSAAALLAGLGAVPEAGAASHTSPNAGVAGARTQILSNETTFTRWAHVYRRAPIYRHPSSSSRKVGRLHWYTEDGYPEVYLLLQARWQPGGREWVELRIPARPNGQVGWVRRGALGQFHLSHQLVVVNRRRMRLSFYSQGHKLWSAPVGVGKPSTPTPPGHFWIREGYKVTNPRSGYYPYAFGTADYSTLTEWPGGGVVGIHGPYYNPRGIPGHISHGCIRLRVRDDRWLSRHLKIGAALRII